MMSTIRNARIDDLLDHAEFVRGIARALLGDDAADDLAQDTWVAALRARTGEVVEARPWLARITHNLGLNRLRAERRRAAHERHSARSNTVPGVDEILAREEIRSRVVNAVLELPENRRTVVLLRYFEGLNGSEIASRLGIPAATVRGRLRDGLAQLRSRLDDEHRGERAAWSVPLAGLLRQPITLPPPSPWTATLRTLLLTVAALTFVSVVGIGLLRWRSDAPIEPRVPLVTTTASDSTPPVTAEPPTVRRNVADSPWFAPVADAQRPTYPTDRPTSRLQGIVLDAASSTPIGGAVVVARSDLGQLPIGHDIADDRGAITRQTWTSSDGSFVFADLPLGPYRLAASDAEGRRGLLAVASATSSEHHHTIALTTRHPLWGHVLARVVDPAGSPALAASVELVASDRRFGPIGHRGRARWIEHSDADGRVDFHDDERLEALFEGFALARSRTEDGTERVGLARIARPEHGNSMPVLEVVVDAPASVTGTLRGIPHDELDRLQLRVLPTLVYGHVYAESDGLSFAAEIDGDRYRVTGLPPGRYRVTAHGTGRVRLQRTIDPASSMPSQPDLHVPRAGAAIELDLQFEAGSALVGRIVDEDARPIAGARITVRFREPGEATRRIYLRSADTGADAVERFASAISDRNGEYSLRGLPASACQVEVIAAHFASAQRGAELTLGPDQRLDFVLSSAGVLQGIARSGPLILRAVDSAARDARPAQDIRVPLESDEAPFTLPGLAAGHYDVIVDGNSPHDPPSRRVEIVAGRTTWVDLRDLFVAHAIGTVTLDGEPLPGALVAVGREPPVTTDVHGMYRLPLRTTRGDAYRVFVDGLIVAQRRLEPMLPGDNSWEPIALQSRPLELIARDVDDRPAVATVHCRTAFDFGGPSNLASRTDESGRLRYRVRPIGALELLVTFPSGYRTKLAAPPATDGDQAPITIVAREGPHADVRVTVTRGDGSKVAGLGLTASSTRASLGSSDPAEVHAASDQNASLRTDADGVAVFRGLPVGTTLIWVSGGMQDNYGYSESAVGRVERPPADAVRQLVAGERHELELRIE